MGKVHHNDVFVVATETTSTDKQGIQFCVRLLSAIRALKLPLAGAPVLSGSSHAGHNSQKRRGRKGPKLAPLRMFLPLPGRLVYTFQQFIDRNI